MRWNRYGLSNLVVYIASTLIDSGGFGLDRALLR